MPNRFRRWSRAGLFVVSVGAWCGVAVAGDADLDTSFGDGGIVTFDGSATGVSVQEDGRIVVAGSSGGTVQNDVMVRRFNADGSPDATFGRAGIVTTDVAESSLGPDAPEFDLARAVVTQVDGRIAVAGSTGYDIDDAPGDGDVLVARYNPDGSLDETFGDDGIVTTEVTPQSVDWASTMVLQPDGKVLVAGAHLPDAIGVGELVGVYADVLVVRYLADGSLDTTFGTNGIVTTRVNADTWDAAHSVALQPDGRIVVAGESQANLLLARYEADGTLDATFGQDGVATMIEGSARSVVVGRDDKIIVAGIRRGTGALLARYDADGSLDSTFGHEDVTVTSFGESARGNSVVVRADGTIVVAGGSGSSPGPTPKESVHLLLRYDDDGVLDTTFGTDGMVVTAIHPDRGSEASAVRLQADDKLVVADFSGAVVRYGTEAGLTPLVEAPLSKVDGFQFLISNYDPSYDWAISTTAGQAAIDSNGRVTVTGIMPGASATVTVMTSRPGYETVSTEATGSSLPDELPATGRGTSLPVIAGLAVALGALLTSVASRQQRQTGCERFGAR